MKSNFEVKELSALNVITMRHMGDYATICTTFDLLMKWAMPRGLVSKSPVMATIYHDDPRLVPTEKLRSDACLVVENTVDTCQGVERHTIKGGLYMVGHFEISMEEFSAVWIMIYDQLRAEGYECIEGDHYELYLNNPETDLEGKWLVDICVPVKLAK